MEKINFIFFGTPDVASETLTLLAESGYTPSLIVTSPDRPSGRGMHMTSTQVAVWAETHNIPCLKPEKLDIEFIDNLRKYNSDLFIVVAYGKILPQTLIDLPELGTINIHYSLLPKYRGASPVEQALLSGDTVTGVTIQQMAFKLDSGAILAQQEASIGLTDTKETLRNRLIEIGAELLVSLLPKIQSKEITPSVQDESKATHCSKIKKEDGQIDPNGDAHINYNKYRAFEGWPGIYFFKDNKRIKITKARLENEKFIIERVVPEGKKETDYKN
ncbi:methionyl-tRNA formyltransferase [Candidatus Nomurabacteria bacterium]|nr:methionyl-tRNA formyltransferase [Candidatus Nomurabacteria bacterium]